MKANAMSKSLDKDFDYAPTSDAERDGDENARHQPYKTRSSRTNKRRLDEQVTQARGNFSAKLAKIVGSRNFNLTAQQENLETDEELIEVQFQRRIANAMVFGGGGDSNEQGSSGSGGSDGQGSSGGGGDGSSSEQGSSSGGGSDGQGSSGGGDGSGSINRSAGSSNEGGGGNKENSSSSNPGGNGSTSRGLPPRLHNLTNPKNHLSRPVHPNPPPPDPAEQWLNIAYRKVLTPEQVYCVMTAVGTCVNFSCSFFRHSLLDSPRLFLFFSFPASPIGVNFFSCIWIISEIQRLLCTINQYCLPLFSSS